MFETRYGFNNMSHHLLRHAHKHPVLIALFALAIGLPAGLSVPYLQRPPAATSHNHPFVLAQNTVQTSSNLNSNSIYNPVLKNAHLLAGIRFFSLTSSVAFSCVVTARANVWCWGAKFAKDLGGDNYDGTPVPVLDSSGQIFTNALQVTANGESVCARKKDGTVWCWGMNEHGELGDGTSADSNIPVQVIDVNKQALQNVKAIASGGNHGSGFNRHGFPAGSHTCALKNDGTVWCWGTNKDGQLGNGHQRDEGVHALADQVLEDNNAPLQNIVSISASLGHTCAVKKDGTVWCWGENPGGFHGFASSYDLKAAQHMDDNGKPLLLKFLGPSQPALYTCGIKNDLTSWCWGYIFSGKPITGASPVVDDKGKNVQPVIYISSGTEHTCLLKQDLSVWCWGHNGDGKVGDGTFMDRSTPVLIKQGPNVLKAIYVESGANHTCAIDLHSQVWCWGNNNVGQLGRRSGFSINTPQLVKFPVPNP